MVQHTGEQNDRLSALHKQPVANPQARLLRVLNSQRKMPHGMPCQLLESVFLILLSSYARILTCLGNISGCVR